MSVLRQNRKRGFKIREGMTAEKLQLYLFYITGIIMALMVIKTICQIIRIVVTKEIREEDMLISVVLFFVLAGASLMYYRIKKAFETKKQ
jgi:uncharacterized membrane protein YqjE